MNKICTSIEQSQKLIKLEIDVNTADMFYCNGHVSVLQSSDFITVNSRMREIYPEAENYIPAWSLTALLGLMPKLYEFEDDPDDGGCQPNLCKGWDNNQWHIVYRSSIYITEWYNDQIDAAFEMIVWLKENGKL